MIKKIKSCGVLGIDAFSVTVEVDLSNGMPSFDIVGLPDASVKESRERIRAALKNCGLEFPRGRVTVNLAPAHIKKAGATYDLPIACAILCATEQITGSAIDEYLVAGELSLDGSICPVPGILPMLMHAREEGIPRALVPRANAREAAIVQGVLAYPAQNLVEVVEHFQGAKELEPYTIDPDTLLAGNSHYDVDFADVKGQAGVKRALEVAAAGGHNVLMIGSPGSGKTMLAQRLPTILPDMTFDEALEVTKIYSVAGLMDEKHFFVATRPFRSPHHTISTAGLAGGGTTPRPGELSLAHNGVLFFDEFPEFSKASLEVMRQPIEDGKVTIARAAGTCTYPCRVMFVAAMNPCRCGYLHSQIKPCTCSHAQVQSYLSRISGPLLDRIDIHLEVSPVNYQDLSGSAGPEETSAKIKERVDRARQIQNERYREMPGIHCNAQLTAPLLRQYCRLNAECENFLKNCFEKLHLSARAHDKILKIARTVADLSGAEEIDILHMAEAVQYRGLDQKYWNYENGN